jgi:serine/threonine-protein kinase
MAAGPPSPATSRTTRSWGGHFLTRGSGREQIVEDVHREGAFRLGIHGLVTVLLWLATTFVYRVLFPALEPEGATGHNPVTDVTVAWWHQAISVSGIVLGLTMFGLTRLSPLSPRRLLDLGFVYYVLGGALVAFIGAVYDVLPGGELQVLGITWTCVWILSYPMTVPASQGPMLVAALAVAVLDPVFAFARVHAITGAFPPAGELVVWAPTYICALLAVVPARIQWRLHAKLRQARELGSYHLTERIGQGGMGEVWRAEHRYLARPAAVKLVSPAQIGASGVEGQRLITRFEREAQATAALESPYSIELFDFGVRRDGTFYYVMELLDGFDLETFVRSFGPMPSGRVAHLLLQVCDSLDDAHGKGLIHRDVKPANVFLCRRGLHEDFAKVLDFGLVKELGHDEHDTMVTVEGVTTGTPAFMSPEQARGAGGVEARSDLYSLGCVAYWLLTGELVFAGRSAMEMVAAHLRDSPPRPSEVVEGTIDPQLEALVMQCLAKQPDDRPSSARVLAEAVGELPVLDDWGPADAERWWELHAPAGARV